MWSFEGHGPKPQPFRHRQSQKTEPQSPPRPVDFYSGRKSPVSVSGRKGFASILHLVIFIACAPLLFMLACEAPKCWVSEEAAEVTGLRKDERALYKDEEDSAKFRSAKSLDVQDEKDAQLAIKASERQAEQAVALSDTTVSDAAVATELANNAQQQAQQDKASEAAAALHYKRAVTDQSSAEKILQSHMAPLWLAAVAWALTILSLFFFTREYTSSSLSSVTRSHGSGSLQKSLMHDIDPDWTALGA